MRQHLASFLEGRGLDLGPGHMPFPVEAIRVDRLTVAEHEELFPELVGNKFPAVDVIADFGSALPFVDVDFVVASHVIEHLANPIRFLEDLGRVLRPGGRAVVVVPNRLTSFDQGRPGTSRSHLVAEYLDEVTEVDDAHIVEYLETVGPFWAGTPLAEIHTLPAVGRVEAIGWHRRRSVHAHCWTVDEFVPLLGAWRIVEAVVEEPEFGFVLEAQ